MKVKVSSIIISSPVFFLLFWEIMVRLTLINADYFPAPSTILNQLIRNIFLNQDFQNDLVSSLWRLIIGILIACPSATALGFFIGLNKSAAAFFNPLIALTYPIPKLAILPFLMIVFGIGNASKIAIIAIGIFYLLLINVIHGIKGLPQEYFDIMRIYRISFWQRMYAIILKGILPDIYNGCKLGIGYGLVMVVAGEFIAARNGIGFFMWNAWDQFRIVDLYVGLFVFALLGFMIFFLFDRLQAGLKWRRE